jgi:hypothetical protein
VVREAEGRRYPDRHGRGQLGHREDRLLHPVEISGGVAS